MGQILGRYQESNKNNNNNNANANTNVSKRKNQNNQQALILNLPDDVMLEILRYLQGIYLIDY